MKKKYIGKISRRKEKEREGKRYIKEEKRDRKMKKRKLENCQDNSSKKGN